MSCVTCSLSFALESYGRSVVIEASTDLVNWLPIWANFLAGPVHFSDPQSGIHLNRFYRTRLP